MRHDQPGRDADHPAGYQHHDVYPIIDIHTRTVVSAIDFNFDFDYIEPSGATPGNDDGLDLYRIANGYSTDRGTRCADYSRPSSAGVQAIRRLDLLPVSFLSSLHPGVGGRGIFPIQGVYWEHIPRSLAFWPDATSPMGPIFGHFRRQGLIYASIVH